MTTKEKQTMATSAGVWIDHHKAVVVLISNDGEEIRQVRSGIGSASSSTGGAVADDIQQRRFTNDLNKYYDEVRTCLGTADSILILGPGEAKGEFKKRLQSKKFPATIAELMTADEITDGQIAADVRRHFSSSPGREGG